MAYLVYGLSESFLCYNREKNSLSRFRSNDELWQECRNDHLLFPLFYFG